MTFARSGVMDNLASINLQNISMSELYEINGGVVGTIIRCTAAVLITVGATCTTVATAKVPFVNIAVGVASLKATVSAWEWALGS